MYLPSVLSVCVFKHSLADTFRTALVTEGVVTQQAAYVLMLLEQT